jgi:hypothetical protein
MEIRTIHYQNRDQLERGVERLTAEGWSLQTVTEIVEVTPGEDTVRAEFRRPEGLGEEPHGQQ